MTPNKPQNIPDLTQNQNQSPQNLEVLSDEQIRELVEQKLDYLKWLIRYSKANHLNLLPSPEWVNTFACGLSRESTEIMQKYINWEINFQDIDPNILKPTNFYYDLSMLLKSDTKTLWALWDHELWHAEHSDYFDIAWQARRAKELWLPVSSITLFFNWANEDPFIWRWVSKKWPARKNMVEHLYKNIATTTTSWAIDMSQAPKIEQLKTKIAYHWLNNDFPKTYDVQIICDEEVEEIFRDEILPYFDDIISPDIPNEQRMMKKNSIFFPILERLWQKDLEKQMQLMEMMKKMIENMTPEERENLKKEAIKEIDKKNLKDLQKEIPGIDWQQDENWEFEFKPKESNKDDENKSKVLQKKIESAIKDHEDDTKKAENIRKKISGSKNENDTKKLFWEIDKVKSKKVKWQLQKDLQKKLISQEQERQRQLQDMITQGFNQWEEKYFEAFIQLESQIEPYVDEFIRALIDYIPKLREYILEWNYHSGTVYDIPKAGRKIKMGHYDIYWRKEEHETMSINLWISISLDVSGSMRWEKIEESLKLLVFLWIFCQKLSIPFYINTIWVNPKEIKQVNTDYITSKWSIMKATFNLEKKTNMAWSFKQVREVQIEQKYHRPEIEFLPIIITDWIPSEKNNPQNFKALQKLINEFEWLDLIFGLSLDEDEKETLSETFRLWKKVFLDDATEILTKWQFELIDYLVSNKDRIFKIED